MRTYYNTNAETGDQLKQSCISAMSQQEAILAHFKLNPGRHFNPADISSFFPGILFGNIKRAMTNLTDAGYLVKTSLRTMGKYGKMNFNWRLNTNHKHKQKTFWG